ncbi:uncharacterized protein LOC109598323 [Aethina tumida]|uniref:uncharacterized protein LOC109598323 n=1 Tax=Aethina tumida TaxID=116153 RepID=UPI002147816E|nr:uncharacterized protein LOC109598323 [Aethina tumida]
MSITMKKMIKSLSIRSLTYEIQNWKSTNKLDNETKEESSSRFYDFSEHNYDLSKDDDKNMTIEEYIKDERKILSELNYLKEMLSTSETDKLDLFETVTQLVEYLENTFNPDLQKSKTAEDVIDCFLRNKNYFSYYKRLCSHVYHIKNYMQEELQKTLPKANFDIISNHLTNILIFLGRLKDTVPERGNDVSNIMNIVYQLTNIKIEFKIRDTIKHIVEEQKVQVGKCSDFISKVLPILDSEIKFEKHKKHIIAKLPEIFKAELLLEDQIKQCTKDYDYNELARLFFNNEELRVLYEENAKLNRCRISRLAFCQDFKLDDGVFFLITRHLLALKKHFTTLVSLCQEYKADSESCERALDYFHKSLEKQDYILSTGNIVGVNVDTLGEILLRDKFLAKTERGTFNAVIFLFKKHVVFTREAIVGSLSTYNCFASLPIDKLQFQTEDEFQLVFYVTNMQKEILIAHTEVDHGSIQQWRDTLQGLILEKIQELKEAATKQYSLYEILNSGLAPNK